MATNRKLIDLFRFLHIHPPLSFSWPTGRDLVHDPACSNREDLIEGAILADNHNHMFDEVFSRCILIL